jgi:hypothetical protein
MWNEQKNNENKLQFGDYVLWFLKGEKHIWANSRKDVLVHSRYNIADLLKI